MKVKCSKKTHTKKPEILSLLYRAVLPVGQSCRSFKKKMIIFGETLNGKRRKYQASKQQHWTSVGGHPDANSLILSPELECPVSQEPGWCLPSPSSPHRCFAHRWSQSAQLPSCSGLPAAADSVSPREINYTPGHTPL